MGGGGALEYLVRLAGIKQEGDELALFLGRQANDVLLIELAGSSFKLAMQGSALFRAPPLSQDLVRSAERIVTLSQSVELPRLADDLALYAEAAFQHLQERDELARLDAGYGVYASASYTPKGLALTLEARHYRRLFPLSANVKLARASEFSSLSYNQVPTTEPEDNDTELEGMNTCVGGARLRGDVTLRRGVRAPSTRRPASRWPRRR